jgi:predicted transcriptional regulator
MLEDQIKKIMRTKKLNPEDVYKPLKINRINFYKALKTSNLNNKSLKKILNFLGFELSINLKNKNDNKKRVL